MAALKVRRAYNTYIIDAFDLLSNKISWAYS